MTDRIVETEQARDMLVKFVHSHKLPFTASIVAGKHRTNRQNKLQRKWMTEIAEQLGDRTAEEVRGYCKLHFGIPLLREENEAFRLKYDRMLKPLSYEEKLEWMMEPLSVPVTSIMTTRQKTTYLDRVHRHFSEQGIVLTDPGDLLRQSYESEPSSPAPNPGGSEDSGESPSPAAETSSPEQTESPGSGGGDLTEADARRMGAEAREAGKSRKAVPAHCREEPFLTAFHDGFDTGLAEDREPGEGG